MVFLVCLFFVFDFVKKCVFIVALSVTYTDVVHDLDTVHVLFSLNSIGKYF